MIAPTINSYRRLIPGFWAPTDATWGAENRTTALRVIPGSPKSQRGVPYRGGRLEPLHHLPQRWPRDSGESSIGSSRRPGDRQRLRSQVSGAPRLRTLWDAAQRLKGSKMARDWFGSDFVEHYAATREWEEREFRKHISDWELARYFEIILTESGRGIRAPPAIPQSGRVTCLPALNSVLLNVPFLSLSSSLNLAESVDPSSPRPC